MVVVARVSAAEARASLVLVLASQVLATSQRRAMDLAAETVKYAFPSHHFEPRTLEQMEMTTPVMTRKGESSGEKLDMTTPVITKKSASENKWKMSFVLPSKYGSNLPLPKDPSVTIKEVPSEQLPALNISFTVAI